MKRILIVALTIGLAPMLIGWMPSSAVRSSAAELPFTPAVLRQSQPPGPIRQIAGLQSLTFYERTGAQPVANTFSVNSPQLEARLNNLDFGSRDFTGASLEFYDVFYSDAGGNANRDGAYVTIEAVWNFALPNGGGLNIAEVQLNFGPGTGSIFGNEVTSFVGLGDNFIPASVSNAVDGNLQTSTTMGNTVGQSQRLRITIGFPPPPAGCRYSISPASQSFPGDGGTGVLEIFAPPGCEWYAFVDSALINPTSARRGSGNGLISYSVLPASEFDPGPRSETIRIYRGIEPLGPVEATHTVTRESASCPAAAYSIMPGHTVIEAYGQPGPPVLFHVSAPPACAWTASSRTPWITVDGDPALGRGDGNVFYTVERNPGSWRGGVITVAGKVFSVYQNSEACSTEFVCAFFPSCSSTSALATSRQFRDTVLAKTPRGRRYTELYYQFAREAVQAMILHPSLLLRSREAMERYLPVVEAIVKGERPTLTTGDLEEIDGFLNAFADKGSPALRDSIKQLCQDIRDPQVHAEFGLTVTEGPKRKAPAGSALQSIKPMGLLLPPLGLWLVFGIGAGRRKFRLLLSCTMVAMLVISGQLPVVRGQTEPGGRSVRRASERFTRQPGVEIMVPQALRPSPSSRGLAPPSQIAFEANQGQTDPQVKFLARGNGYSLFLTPAEAALRLRIGEPANSLLKAGNLKSEISEMPDLQSAILRMKPLGANPNPRVSGLDELPGKTHYFIGSNRARWRTGVSAYARVKYKGVYPGVDMIYYGNQGELEYDFIVAPGADPGQIRLAFEGADRIELDDNGDLVLFIGQSEVRQRRPLIYQEVDRERKVIQGRYALHEAGVPNRKSHITASQSFHVGFDIGPYDKTKPLIIDPVLAYSTYLGGGGTDEANSIAVDAAGNAYVAGFTDSLNFPTVNNSQPNFGGGQQDAFVSKLDPSGTQVVYSTYLGGDGQDNGTGIAVDAVGNAYVTGYTGSTDFPVRNALQPTKAGDFNAFVVRLNPAGAMLNSTLLGGSFSDYGSSIAVDAAGSIYVAGIATSPNFPTASAVQSEFGGSADVYVAKLNPAATQLVYSSYLGGAGIDGASSIAVDAGGNVYLTGLTSSPNLHITNPLQSTHAGGIFDAFVMKLNPSGTALLYSTYIGGSGVDRSFRIAVDGAGSAYVVGDTDSTNFPVANGPQLLNAGSSDVFVAKLSPSGSQLVYSTYLGGSGIDGGTALAVDASGSAYVTGFTASTNFPTSNPIQQSPAGAYDAFVAKISSSGSTLDYATYIGGSGIDSGFGIAADGSGNAYVMGVTSSADFPAAAALQRTFGGGTADLFIAKIKSAGPAIDRAQIQGKHLFVFGAGFDSGAKIVIDGAVHKKTFNDEQNPNGMLFGKKAGNKIAGGQTVTLQVRNSDGSLSNQLSFRRP